MSPAVIMELHAARAAERVQALFYRALATSAGMQEGDTHAGARAGRGESGVSGEHVDMPSDLAERLNGLHADEQHHLSRLTARLMELGEPLEELGPPSLPEVGLEAWESLARIREQVEIDRYESLLQQSLDEETQRMIEEFLKAERHHAESLGGKWMIA
jgi:hypothetical protein